MDLILNYLDPVLLGNVYRAGSRSLARAMCANGDENIITSSSISSSITTTIIDGSRERICELAMDPDLWQRHSPSLFYLLFGTVCYYLNFDHALTRHPKFRPRQVRAEIRGLARIYSLGAASPWYEVAQYPLFYHRFVVPTPFSAYAFGPLETWVMSLPIYAYSFLWPMSDVAQLVIFFVTNLWTFVLHDNRDQFHTVHHKTVERNFGQFLDLWDRLGGTYADPNVFFSSVCDKRVKPIF
ncbi:hypothetical protein C7999DRAFT_28798 [Corynascus novoguineensis]|uniref:Fatty acid hydroxylase domain-containing protein n=1 Tax=Corynascus novoguineensis TaxID=1126955 RepID=A0AAN7HTC2_9PEZI|nr:hypothetical protein C7999DRAFT_28798 [Corynascus novoguineensis]